MGGAPYPSTDLDLAPKKTHSTEKPRAQTERNDDDIGNPTPKITKLDKSNKYERIIDGAALLRVCKFFHSTFVHVDKTTSKKNLISAIVLKIRRFYVNNTIQYNSSLLHKRINTKHTKEKKRAQEAALLLSSNKAAISST